MLKIQKPSDTADIMVVHPVYGQLEHDDGTKLSVTIYGPETAEHDYALDQAADRNAESDYSSLTREEKRQRKILLIADCIKSFNNFEDVDLGYGKVDPEDKVAILSNCRWLREILDNSILDMRNFIPKDVKSKKKS